MGHPGRGRRTATGCSSSCRRAGERPVDVGICGAVHGARAVVAQLAGSDVRVLAQNMHQEQKGAFTGEVSAAMLRGARGRRRGAGPLRAPRVLRRDRPRAPGEGAGRARGGAPADPLRRRDRGGARAGRDRAQAAPPGAGGPREGGRRAAGRRGDRLRADLGDRHRAGGHARAGAGGDRVRARAGGRPLERGGRAHARALRRKREARERRRDPGPAGRGRCARGRREPGSGLVRPDRGRAPRP